MTEETAFYVGVVVLIFCAAIITAVVVMMGLEFLARRKNRF